MNFDSLGAIKIAGVKNKDLNHFLKKSLQTIYHDNFEIYSYVETPTQVALYLAGSVNKPGLYDGYPTDSLLTYIDRAGGINNKGSYRNIHLIRNNKVIEVFDLYDFILKGSLKDRMFKDSDTLFVPHKQIELFIQKEGDDLFSLEMTQESLSGQHLLDIVSSQGEITDLTLSRQENNKLISQSLTVEQFANQELSHRDTIDLINNPLNEKVLINIQSESTHLRSLSVSRKLLLSDVLKHISVDPDIADYKSLYIKRISAKKKQKKSIEDSLARLERNALLALSNSQGESQIRAREAELTQSFIESIKTIEPLGIIPLEGQHDIFIEHRDTIVIPNKSSTVDISGEVLYPQVVVYRKGTTLSEYIKRTGGFTHKALQDNFIVIHPDQTVIQGDSTTIIYPGDQIIVLPKIDTKDRQVMTDFSQILYQLAVTAKIALGL